MGTKSPVRMSEMGVGAFNGDDLGKEFGLLLRERSQGAGDRERELNVHRSGSAPPTVEGSLNAIELMNDDELRSDPAYLSYYYSHVNLNPRLPPPVLSKEDWRSTQRLGGIGDMRKSSGGDEMGGAHRESSLSFDRQPSLNEGNVPGEWVTGGGDGLIGLSLGRQNSFADIFQDDHGQRISVPNHSSRPSSHKHLHQVQSARLQNKKSETFASVLASCESRNTTPDSNQLAKAPSSNLPNVAPQLGFQNNKVHNGSHSFNSATYGVAESDNLLTALSGIKLSCSDAMYNNKISKSKCRQEFDSQNNCVRDQRHSQNYVKQRSFPESSDSVLSSMSPYMDSCNKSVGLADFSNSSFNSSSYLKAPMMPTVASPGNSPVHYQKADAFAGYGLDGYFTNPTLPPTLANSIGTGVLPPLFENAAAASAIAASGLNLNGSPALQSPNRIGNYTLGAPQMSFVDPLYIQYLKTAEYAAQAAANFIDSSIDRSYMNGSYLDLLGMQESYVGAPFLGKATILDNGYFGNNAVYGLNGSYPSSPLANPRSPAFSSFAGGGMGSQNHDRKSNLDGGFLSTLLEEFKCSKSSCFELSDIARHVIEFSSDQYGSRFIQQKLETATIEEKNMVFKEIIPHALTLMTDVFGNYVVQKFFEHGSAAQIRELANVLDGHVLALSLQMYGCRVIQKAIEVVKLDQQTKIVAELDGHVMRCVRDQNGNHVIQKCIECIPEDAIQFIISSFYDQVVTLSTHPYGCRVIQRVLERCHDPKTQKIVMDEIMQSVCMLAQDQYGNYVVQHVLEHGKPQEQSEIIKKLAGKIVQMSQQKFASNVVEKCLTFGGPVERQILVNEMLGSTDENEPLQAMMKDQFANYVVQKVLETCDDQQRELILSRIKVHLTALKKYTYGKHIVARVEKLVAAGERRIGLQSSYFS